MTYSELWQESKEKYGLNDVTIDYLFKNYLNLGVEDKIKNVKINNARDYLNKVEQIKKGMPIQYVIGNVNFYGYNFYITPDVLIPKFETEELVYHTKNYINKYFKDNPTILDVGAGSGIIGLSLKKEIPDSIVTMVDISEEALKISKKNAENMRESVSLYKSDMLEEVIKRKAKFDVLISNPPYLTKEDEIMDIVKKKEPAIALYGGEDGLKYYRIMLKDAKKILNEKAIVAFEIGAYQGKDIINIATELFKGHKYEIKKDFQGRDRMFFLFYNLID